MKFTKDQLVIGDTYNIRYIDEKNPKMSYEGRAILAYKEKDNDIMEFELIDDEEEWGSFSISDIVSAVPKSTIITKSPANTYTESTIKEPGWYWFVPGAKSRKGAGFVYVDSITIKDNDLKCPYYQGEYIGPIVPPE